MNHHEETVDGGLEILVITNCLYISSFFLASSVETRIFSCRVLISSSFLEDSSWKPTKTDTEGNGFHGNVGIIMAEGSHLGCCTFPSVCDVPG